ncbi:cucumber peeling cupredoxin-like [Triticum urartu]|uniref:Phytocyanin domain-containing protein n=1 Tax=Triticum urartu TaxID=4572 RepID=A0A8R7P5Y8_TRIUA|nr:cucumber peeling cupredoxin-like [Triticum urartu]
MASKAHLSFLLLAVVAASLAGPSAGIFHIVGAGKGWRIAPNQTYYADWARTRDIHVGDKLMFLYRSGVYDIVQVPTKELFDACSMDNVTMRYQLGPTIIKLDTPGPRYYFCGVGEHCEGGQKVAVNVSGDPAAPATATATAAPEAPAAAALPPASSTAQADAEQASSTAQAEATQASSTAQAEAAQASSLAPAEPAQALSTAQEELAQASTMEVDPAKLVDAKKKL